MDSDIKYRDYYIAFLDILGFSNIIKTESPKFIHKLFTNIKRAKRHAQNDRCGEITENTKFYFFSDTIICVIPASEENALEAIASNCMLIQHALWSYGSPIWLRGAITKGPLYCGKEEIFGPALIEAYKMEQKLSVYPRIIMTCATYENGIKESTSKKDIEFIVNTTDGLKMVETFYAFDLLQGTDKVKEMVINELKNEIDPHVREKYLWVIDNFNKYTASQNNT